MIEDVTNRERVKHDLLEFARRLTREVCVRAANHKPDTSDERRQSVQGPVKIADLDCVRKAIDTITVGL